MRFVFRCLDAIVAALILVVLVVVAAELGRRPEQSGIARIVDGDTLDLGGRRIRLVGIDAPELAQPCGMPTAPWPCGRAAREALRAMTAGIAIRCEIGRADKWGRALAVCRAGEADLGATLVRAGQAVAYGRYESEERDAKARRAGVWAGPFERPSDWRRRQGEAGHAVRLEAAAE